VYGEHEVGGTNVFILSPVPFAELGLPTGLGADPLPNLTWAALTKIPKVVGFGCVGLTAIYWITHRRQEVAAAERGEAAGQRERKEWDDAAK
jgi:formate dehydrogenase iron-sulfur subunit